MVDDTRDQGEYNFRGKWMFCSILVFHVRDMLSSRLISDIYTLFLDGFRLFASCCRCF